MCSSDLSIPSPTSPDAPGSSSTRTYFPVEEDEDDSSAFTASATRNLTANANVDDASLYIPMRQLNNIENYENNVFHNASNEITTTPSSNSSSGGGSAGKNGVYEVSDSFISCVFVINTDLMYFCLQGTCVDFADT